MQQVEERRAVRALILTPERETLLFRLRPPGEARCFWIAPGGGLDQGETIEDGLKRELREEPGWSSSGSVRWSGAATIPSTGALAGYRSARSIASSRSRASIPS